MAGVMVIFDFDKTIIDCDSDNWVIDELGATELFERLLPTMPWNSLMNRMMEELHARGKSVQDISDVLKRAPLDPHVAQAIKSAHSLGCELKIVSDANMFFIETILRHHGLLHFFSEVITNPSSASAEGNLKIAPYHDFHTSPHGCPNCPPNMCKGSIVDRILEGRGKDSKVIYLGDGKGDFCPSLRLCEEDCVMPRKNYPLWELISKNPSLIKAEVREWSNGEDQERILLRLLREEGMNSSALLSTDCKVEIISSSTCDCLLHALPVTL